MEISFNKTKVVATVGPASNTREKLMELILAGVDIFRLNFSHGSHEQHLEVLKHVRSLNKEHNLCIGVLQDLQGPKIRTREVENNGVELVAGEKIVITTEKIIGNSQRISCTYDQLPQDVETGDMILIDDGKIELKVLGKQDNEVECVIIYGGLLKSKKGINLPDTNVSASALTDKDYEDLLWGIENDMEWIALSFVRTADEVLKIKEIIKEKGGSSRVIAKIEKPEALENIDEIIQVSDGLMVARGDLGVEIVMEEVPLAQKSIVAKCNKAGKPVIIATQMMESMIENPRPTRAETNDVANAVMDGADALMLSAETASGKYPSLVVKSMTRTIKSIEEHGAIYEKYYDIKESSDNYYNDAIVTSACKLAKHTNAKAIIGVTRSGYTGFQIASHRPKAHIFVFTDNRKLLNTLSLVWGVRGFYYQGAKTTDETFEDISKQLIEDGHLKSGDAYVITTHMPIQEKLRTNVMKINVVP
jgi:pyruvate kinase